jgi:hypothetical protein
VSFGRGAALVVGRGRGGGGGQANKRARGEKPRAAIVQPVGQQVAQVGPAERKARPDRKPLALPKQA